MNMLKQVETKKTNQNSNVKTDTSSSSSIHSLEYGDVLVYREMAEQPAVKINLIEQIRSQLNQLEEMNHKRQFLMKEILDLTQK